MKRGSGKSSGTPQLNVTRRSLLIGAGGAVWSVKSIPIANHSRGFPRLVTAFLICGLVAVLVLWFGFAANYSLMRDLYFAVAMAHVLAEAPFLLRMI